MADRIITVTDPSVVTNDTLSGYNNYSDIDGQLGTTMTPTEATNGHTVALSDGVVHEVTTKPVGTTNGEFSAVVSDPVTVDLSGGATAPVLSTATVENAAPSSLVMTYNETLDNTSTPATGDFAVNDGAANAVTNVAVSGTTVTLTLTNAIANGDTVTVSYTSGANPIQDAAGNDAVNLTNQAVTNNVSAGGDITDPVPVYTYIPDAAPNNVVVEFSEPVITSSISGVAYLGAEDITGIVSGSGTNTITYSLSGSVAVDTVFQGMSFGVTDIEDVSGNPLDGSGSPFIVQNLIEGTGTEIVTGNPTAPGANESNDMTGITDVSVTSSLETIDVFDGSSAIRVVSTVNAATSRFQFTAPVIDTENYKIIIAYKGNCRSVVPKFDGTSYTSSLYTLNDETWRYYSTIIPDPNTNASAVLRCGFETSEVAVDDYAIWDKISIKSY